MVCCAVVNCKNNSVKISKKEGITFHRFPRDTDRRREWEISVNREEKWCSSSSSVVCSQHFNINEFYVTDSGLRRLSSTAVPSINISICQESEPTLSSTPPVDIKPTDTDEVIELKYKVRRLEVIAKNRNRRLNLTRQVKRRLQRKLHQMECILKHLIRNKKEKKPDNS